MKNLFRWGAMFALSILALLTVGSPAVAQHLTQHFAAFDYSTFTDLGLAVIGSTIGATVPTLVDVAKRLNPDGTLADIAERLAQKNEIIADLGMKEGNLPTGHQYTQRTGLPTIYFRLLNQGVPPSKSLTAQVTEQAAILEGRSQIDRDLAMLNGNSAAWRLSETKPFYEAFAEKVATTIFYGNAGTDPEQFTGLSTRYSSLSAGNGGNIVDAGGTGSDNASIWVIGHGDGFHGIYPKGSIGGLQHEDLGVVDAFDSSNNRFRAYMDWFQWKVGIVLPDWRNVVRIANLDISNLVAQSGQANITNQLIKAVTRIQTQQGVKIYMNRTIRQYFEVEQYAAVKGGGGLTFENVAGQPVMSWRGFQIRTVDSLLETEARVV
jgi:hypothetical protein